MKTLEKRLRTLPLRECSPGFVDRVLDQRPAETRGPVRTRRWWTWAAAAAAIVVLAAGLVLAWPRTPAGQPGDGVSSTADRQPGAEPSPQTTATAELRSVAPSGGGSGSDETAATSTAAPDNRLDPPPFWFDIMPLSPVTSLAQCHVTYRGHSYVERNLEAREATLEIRSARGLQLVAEYPDCAPIPQNLTSIGGGIHPADNLRIRNNPPPEGNYLVALVYGRGGRRIRCSNVAALVIDAQYDPAGEPPLRLISVPPAARETLPSLWIVATGPREVDPKFTMSAAAFPTLTIDGVDHALAGMTWTGPDGPLQPGQRYMAMVRLAGYQPPVEPKAQYRVAARVLDYRSAEVTVPATDDLARVWDGTVPKPTWQQPRLSGTVRKADGEPADGYEVYLHSGDRLVREKCDRDGGYAFFNVPPGQYDLSVSPPAMGQPLLRMSRLVLEVDNTLVQDLSFEPRFTLSGNVTYRNGAPAAGETVSVTCASADGLGEFVNFTTTDAQGHYELGLPFDAVSYVGLSGTAADGPRPRKNNIKASAGPADLVIPTDPRP